MSDRMIQVHKTLPSPSDVHYDALLTDFSIGAIQDFQLGLASSIFPRITVRKQTDRYRIWDQGSFLRNEARKRAPGTPVPRSGVKWSTDSYYADIYHWGTQLDDEAMDNADDPAMEDRVAVNYVMQTLAIRGEVDFVTNFMKTGVWGKDYLGVASGAVSGTSVLGWNISGSTPIRDIQVARRRVLVSTGQRANTMVIGYDVRDYLDLHADLIARLVNGQTPGQAAEVSDADLARLFKVDRVITADAVVNSAKEGAAASIDFVAGDFVWVGYVDPNPSLQTMTAGVRFVWNGGRMASGAGTRIERWYNQDKHSTMIDGFANWGDKITASGAGVFFSNMVA